MVTDSMSCISRCCSMIIGGLWIFRGVGSIDVGCSLIVGGLCRCEVGLNMRIRGGDLEVTGRIFSPNLLIDSEPSWNQRSILLILWINFRARRASGLGEPARVGFVVNEICHA
jgi:hypothetical protein